MMTGLFKLLILNKSGWVTLAVYVVDNQESSSFGRSLAFMCFEHFGLTGPARALPQATMQPMRYYPHFTYITVNVCKSSLHMNQGHLVMIDCAVRIVWLN